MAAESTLRVGILGAGDNTRRRHIPGLQAIDGVEIVAVCNRSRASSQRVCDAFNIPRAEENPDAVLGDPQIDAVVIGTWPYMHCPFTLKALEQGKHVMTEARMAMNGDEAEQMLAASRARPELVTQVVPSPFTLHYDHLVRELVEQRIGGLVGVRATLGLGGPAQFEGAAKTWRRNERYSGHNVMMLGIYYEAMMRWLGPVARLAAQARVIVDRGENPETGQEEPITIPDHLAILGRMQRDDASFELMMSSVAGFDTTQEVWIYGRDGSIHVDLAGHALAVGTRGDEAMQAVDIDARREPGWRVEEEFINAIRGREPIRFTTFEDGLRYMRFTDAVHESARTGQMVEVVNETSDEKLSHG